MIAFDVDIYIPLLFFTLKKWRIQPAFCFGDVLQFLVNMPLTPPVIHQIRKNNQSQVPKKG